MKKAFLYTFAAVVLGVGIMLFPLWTYFRSVNEEGPIVVRDSKAYFIPMSASQNLPDYMKARIEQVPAFGDSNIQPKPTDASLQILIIGFIAAMVVYVIARRKVSRPIPAYRFPPC